MDSQDLIMHVQSLGLPREGIEYVRSALAAPSRIVGKTRYLNVTSRFASQKLGEAIQSESHTCELPFVHMLELDDDVLACLDQPPPLFVESIDKRGRRHRGKKTADQLVIQKGRIELKECKKGEELKRLVIEEPLNWILDATTYRYLPAEQPARALGLLFSIHNADDIGPIYAKNLRTLVNAKRAFTKPLDERVLCKALRLLNKHNGLTMLDLATELNSESVTPIIGAVLSKQLHVLLRWQLLSHPLSTTIYASQEHALAADRALKAASEADCLREEHYQAPLALSEKAFNKAIENLARIRRIRCGELEPTRSDYRHIAALRGCSSTGELPLLALAPSYHLRGCRQCLSDTTNQIIVRELKENYARNIRLSLTAVHSLVTNSLSEEGLSPVSYETVRQRKLGLSRADLAHQREGYKAANAAMPPVPRHLASISASYAWERAHVDSTPLDEKIWLSSSLAKVLARPTIYLLVDESCSFILAYWVCFANAGDQAVACLLRDCIRRHGQLPCAIVHDKGSEYFSVFSETFSAAAGVDLERRPSGAPRWGGQVESAFNRINHLVANRLPGNMQNDKRGRSSTAETRSAAHAQHDVVQFLVIVEEQLMNGLNERPVDGEVASPTEKFRLSELQFAGMSRRIAITPELLAHTAIPVPESHRIDCAHGITFKHRRYIGAAIRAPSLHGQKVPIRWEPYNPCVIYAAVEGKWERLTCKGYAELESTNDLHRAAELHLRFDTASASRSAKMKADRLLAARLRDSLSVSDARPPKLPISPPEPKTEDMFERARTLDLDRTFEEVVP